MYNHIGLEPKHTARRYASVIWNSAKWNSVKWNETRRIGAIFACSRVARVCQRQLGFLVLLVDQRSNFSPIGEDLWLISHFSDFRQCWSVLEVFALKVESCQKSRRILDVFALPNLAGAPLAKLVSTLSPRPRATSPGKVSWRYGHYPQSYRPRRWYAEI